MSKVKAPYPPSNFKGEEGQGASHAAFERDEPALRSEQHHKVSVAVLVDLVRHPGAGGHVKAWERFADAARHFPDDLDMTLYFLGDGLSETSLADNVRIRTVPPAFGTATIPWLRNGGGDTDLASYNPHLARRLPEHDVFHATSAFAFAKTARTVARLQGRPLVSSVHTSAGKFARIYTGEIIERLIGHGMLSKLLIDTIGIPDLSARNLDRARDRVLSASDHILVSNAEDERHVRNVLPDATISFLRRGVDKSLFKPTRRDRSWLRTTYGVPEDRPVVLFAGRVDESKRVMTAARAVLALIDQGEDLHLMIAGAGSEGARIEALLGPRVTLTGNLMQDDLARLMASADMFVFPSESDVIANAVIEAKASGLPVIVTRGATTSQLVSAPGQDGVLASDGSMDAYADAMRGLLLDKGRRIAIGRQARQTIETSWPDWCDVLAEDLLPIWRGAVCRAETKLQDRSEPLVGNRFEI
jgi:glycosyltransferase involved in cell wall biosynthesis